MTALTQQEQQTLPATAAPPPRLPRSVELLTADDHRPARVTGFRPSGWLPPAYVRTGLAELLPGLIQQYEVGMAPAAHNEVVAEVGSLYAVTRSRDDISSHVVRVYASDLAEYPLWVIQEACRSWRRREPWFPAIAELRTECEHHARPARNTLQRMRVLLEVRENPAPRGEVTMGWALEREGKAKAKTLTTAG